MKKICFIIFTSLALLSFCFANTDFVPPKVGADVPSTNVSTPPVGADPQETNVSNDFKAPKAGSGPQDIIVQNSESFEELPVVSAISTTTTHSSLPYKTLIIWTIVVIIALIAAGVFAFKYTRYSNK